LLKRRFQRVQAIKTRSWAQVMGILLHDRVFCMYESKQEVLAKAMNQVSRGGITDLTFSGMAAVLELTPEALKSLFPNSASMNVAITAESGRRLLTALQNASSSSDRVISAIAIAYLTFAQAEPSIFSLGQTALLLSMKGSCDVPLWQFLLTNVRRHYAHDSSVHAALALLALLNGLALLSSKKAVDVNGLFDALSLGVNAWLMAADFNENKSLPMNHNPI